MDLLLDRGPKWEQCSYLFGCATAGLHPDFPEGIQTEKLVRDVLAAAVLRHAEERSELVLQPVREGQVQICPDVF